MLQLEKLLHQRLSKKLPGVILFSALQEKVYLVILMCRCVKLHEFMCTVCVQESREARRGYWIHGTGIIDNCKLPCICWELNLDCLQEQVVTLIAQPSLQKLLFMVFLRAFEATHIYPPALFFPGEILKPDDGVTRMLMCPLGSALSSNTLCFCHYSTATSFGPWSSEPSPSQRLSLALKHLPSTNPAIHFYLYPNKPLHTKWVKVLTPAISL